MYSASVSIICHHTNTRDGTKASTNSTSGLILLLFLDGQAECVQTYMCVCITNLSSYCVSALILPWNSSVCLCPIASMHMHMLSCQFQRPQILQQLTLDPSLFLQLPHSAGVSHPSPKALCLFAGQSSLVLRVIAPGPAEAHALLCWHHRLTSPCELWSDSMSCRYTRAPSRSPR